ncbi:MAG: hypothetical protein R6X20_15845 [Phycisphaerae bacterium]
MRRPSTQRGFALLMALLLVLLAGVALAGVARRSIVTALDARDAARDLQRRWAVRSCRATLLGHAERLLDEAERGRGDADALSDTYKNAPKIHRTVACRLADIDYELVLTDEQAKLNVNTLLEDEGLAQAQSVVSRMVTATGGGAAPAVEVRLRTLAVRSLASEKDGFLPEQGAYGQIFDGASARELVGTAQAPGVSESVTCWGDGKVNVRRAPETVLKQVCEKALTRQDLRHLLEACERNPYVPLSGMLAEVHPKQREKVYGLLTDRSRCHGLWVIARGNQRSWYTFAVNVGAAAEGAAGGAGRQTFQVYEFAW